MRWFINSTKESAGFNDNNNFQAQIDEINRQLDDVRNRHTTRSNGIYEEMQKKGIRINNILNHQGNQDERIVALEDYMKLIESKIDKLEKSLDKWGYRIENLEGESCLDEDEKKQFEKRLRTLEGANDSKANKRILNQAIKKEPKFRRMKNTYSDVRYASAYAIAQGYTKAGFNQVQIAGKLNALGHRTPKGMEFTERHVTDLMCNPFQKAKFMEGKEKKAKL